MDEFKKRLGVALLVLMALFCVYEMAYGRPEARITENKPRLKMVNIFSRHGDRSPSDPFPMGDPHAKAVELFWPNGMHNLTDAGEFRLFMIGLDTRRQYSSYLGFDSSELVAFSSPIERCIQSMQFLLRGMYEMEPSTAINDSGPLPTGSGSPNEWKKVSIDTESVPSLVYSYLNECRFRRENPSPVDANLLNDPGISSLPGSEKLRETLKRAYNQDFDFSSLGLWSTLAAELNLRRTQATIHYIDHMRGWINEPIEKGSKISLFQLYEQVAVLAYKDRILGPATYVQLSPIVTSLIESQLVALGHNATSQRMKMYEGKKMVLYSSHDSILQKLLAQMGIIRFETDFERRFKEWNNSDDLDKFLSGLTMSSFGMSVRFELWELESATTRARIAYVQASMYNKQDAYYQKVEYRPIELGLACQKLFIQKHPSSQAELLQFYETEHFQIDDRYSCPFGLLQNVTSELMLDEKKMHDLCD